MTRNKNDVYWCQNVYNIWYVEQGKFYKIILIGMKLADLFLYNVSNLVWAQGTS